MNEALMLLENPEDYLELVENPDPDYDYGEDDLEDIYPPKPRRRNPVRTDETTFKPSNLTWLLIGGLGYLGWCWYASRGKKWSWIPWKPASVALSQWQLQARMQAAKNNPGGATIFHNQSIIPVAPARGLEYESIQLIVP